MKTAICKNPICPRQGDPFLVQRKTKGLYCSYDCRYAHMRLSTEQKIRDYMDDPLKCKNEECAKSLTWEQRGNSFCSHHCHATVHNRPKKKPKKVTSPIIIRPKKWCSVCSKKLHSTTKSGLCKEHYLMSDAAKQQRGKTFATNRKFKTDPRTGKEHYLMSSLEEQFFDLLIENDIDFSEPNPIKYIGLDNRSHMYFPDFLLEDGTIIEIKGFFTEEDKIKMRLVQEQNPELKIVILFKNTIKGYFGVNGRI